MLVLRPDLTPNCLQRLLTLAGKKLTPYSIITPLKCHEFENIMENGAFALKEQMLHFP